MDFRPSSAVVDEQVNQLAASAVERREELIERAVYLASL
jgi:hypothetical protein